MELTGNNIKDHEEERKLFFEQSGYDVLIVWEQELENIELLKEKLVRFENA